MAASSLTVGCVGVFFFNMLGSGVVFVLAEEMCISALLSVFVFGKGGLYSVPSIVAGSKCVIVWLLRVTAHNCVLSESWFAQIKFEPNMRLADCGKVIEFVGTIMQTWENMWLPISR